MKKISKILFLLVLIIMLVFTLSISVNAAETTDYSGYEELEGDVSTPKDTNTNTNTNTNTDTNTKNTNTQNKANTATTAHPQTGVFNNTVCISIAAVTIVAIIIAYVKMKKYNY